MASILVHFKKLDWILIIASVSLVSLGLLSIYSSSLTKGDFTNFYKQFLFLVAGIFLMFGLSFFDLRTLKDNSYFVIVLYIISLLILIAVLFFGVEVRGATSWFRFLGLNFGPVELVKVVLIILLAKYFSVRHIEMYRFFHILISGIYVILPSFLVFFQPDLGSVIILVLIWLGIMVLVGIKIRHLLLLFLLGILIFVISWYFLLHDYQKLRIISFFESQKNPLTYGYNLAQSQIAIGSGGITGEGWGRGFQVQFGFLPEPQTDFIFAAIAEEGGLLSVLLLFLFYFILLERIIKISVSASGNFLRLIGLGTVLLITSQIFVNIGMVSGIFPITGISLPLVSYGGSNLIFIFILLGLIQAVKLKEGLTGKI